MSTLQADAKVTKISGKAYAERNGTRLTLVEGSEIFASDKIITDTNGGVEVVFRDNAVIRLGPNSQVAVQDFVYDGESNPSFAVELATGVMTSISGEVVKQNPAAFKISTPRATIGIRGTETYHSVSGETESHAVVHISEGHIVLLTSSDGRAITLNAAMQAVTLHEGNAEALSIRTFLPHEMDKLQDSLRDSRPQQDVQEGQEGQQAPQNADGHPAGDEASQTTTIQAAANSTVVQDEIRVIVVAEAGNEALAGSVQDALQSLQDSSNILIDSPLITPLDTNTTVELATAASGAGVGMDAIPDTPPTPTPDPIPDPIPDPVPTPPPGQLLDMGNVITFQTATEGNDTISAITVGTTGRIDAGGGDDVITVSGSSAGTILGGAGNDTIRVAGASAGSISGGDGNDVITVTGTTDSSVSGGAGNDTITVDTLLREGRIDAGSGDDSITIGNSIGGKVDGGEGNDSLHLGSGQTNNVTISNVEHVYGGTNADSITLGTGGNVTIEKAATITGSSGLDNVTLGNGGNTVTITGVETITAGAGADNITLTSMNGTTVYGGAGDDVIAVENIVVANSVNKIDGGAGNDEIVLNNWVNGASLTLDFGHSLNDMDKLVFAKGTTIGVGRDDGQGNWTVDVTNASGKLSLTFTGMSKSEFDAIKDTQIQIAEI